MYVNAVRRLRRGGGAYFALASFAYGTCAAKVGHGALAWWASKRYCAAQRFQLAKRCGKVSAYGRKHVRLQQSSKVHGRNLVLQVQCYFLCMYEWQKCLIVLPPNQSFSV
jgi:hypothetical protein